MSTTTTESRIQRAYAEKTPGSARLARRAEFIFPSGVTHAGRFLKPHPLFTSHARGSRKWDVDGNEYVDYFGGHGALMLGHNHPAVIEAVQEALSRGVHFGSSHEGELEWAELIRELIPSAERVRFTVTGTETTHLAMRLARAHTGKPNIVRFAGHFHGWHDQAVVAAEGSPGIPVETAAHVPLVPPGDIGLLRKLFSERDDIAAVILEPTGASFGLVPLPEGFLAELRALTEEHGILLIFDEVITGFRCSCGGAQAFYGVTPDLTSLAKIVAGGFPGAALVGKAEILDQISPKSENGKLRAAAILHQGTYNSGPVTAAAGIATLKMIRDTDIIARANRTARALRDQMNEVIQRKGAPWIVYGEFSACHIFTNPNREAITLSDIRSARVPWNRLKGVTPLETIHEVRAGFLVGGVDIMGWPGATVSGVHSEEDVERTVNAFENLLHMLAEEGRL